jgi:hypothetical protein
VNDSNSSSARSNTGSGRYSRAGKNGYRDPGEPKPGQHEAYATAIARLIYSRQIAKRTLAALAKSEPPEWNDVAAFVRESKGIEGPKKRIEAVNKTFANARGGRGKDVFGPILAALNWACQQDPGDEEDVPEGPPPFTLDLVSSGAFFAQDFPLHWLVKGLMVEGEPGVIAGPSKALKTSILIDKVVSLATATPFLGKFEVPTARRVALLSGESGRRVIQSSAKQVCLARGLTAHDLGNIFWGFTLPQLTNAEHLNVLRKTIEDNGLEYIAIDPFYLTLMAGIGGIDPKSMFEMGPLLQDVATVCIEAGCTPELAHHFTKKREEPFGVPDLSEMAYAGIGQFVRQWTLIAPRERFDAEIGLFKLHFSYGGSAGHCGEFVVDIEVGKLEPDMDRRCWRVTIANLSEQRQAQQSQRQAEAERKRAERDQSAAVERNRKEIEDMAAALAIFRKAERHRMTVRALRTATNWNADKVNRIVFVLSQAGSIRPCVFKVKIGSRAEKDCDGYEVVKETES